MLRFIRNVERCEKELNHSAVALLSMKKCVFNVIRLLLRAKYVKAFLAVKRLLCAQCTDVVEQ